MVYSIKQIEEIIKTITDENDPFIKKCLHDERKGVQKLVKRWQKEQERKKQEQIRLEKLTIYEREARRQGFHHIAGIDEVGRGPLAGPVVSAAVILPENFFIPGIDDSKKLTAKKRDELYGKIMDHAVAVGIGIVEAEEIDKLNILKATKKAMNMAINELSVFPDYILVDAVVDTP